MQVNDYVATKYGVTYDPLAVGNINDMGIHNLLAEILQGTKIESAQAMAERIIKDYGSMSLLNSKNPTDLNNRLRIGIKNCRRIISLFEIGRRTISPVDKKIILIRGPEDVYNLLKVTETHLKEYFYCIYLNTRNIVINYEVVCTGGLSSCTVHPRDVFKKAIEYNASHVIVSHNHPSGEFEPSKADDEITRTLKESGEIMRIPLTDHIIIASNGYYSYSKSGRL